MKEKDQLVFEGRYLEAESLRLKINELKEHMSGQKRKDLNSHHDLEWQNMDNEYSKELFIFSEQWENKFINLRERARLQDENLIFKHRREMEELIAQLEQTLARIVKFSKEYIDYRQTERKLVRYEK